MIERAATCLESGGRHLLRISKKPFQKHRSLHSAFWSHGAGDISLPAWWHAFLQVPSTSDPLRGARTNGLAAQGAAFDGIGLGLLDFLYPGQTLAFIRRCVSENAATLRRRRRSRILLQRSRSYTSTADNFLGVQEEQDDAAYAASAQAVLNGGASALESAGAKEADMKAKLNRLLYGADQSSNTEQMWQIFQRLQEASISLDPGDLAQLFKCLSASSGVMELRRTRDLLDSVPLSERRAIHYACAISAALKQNDLKSAVAIHREAASQIQGSFGSSVVFQYAIEHSNFGAALAVWQHYWNNTEIYFGPADIWNGFDALPLSKQMQKAREAVDFAIGRIEATSFDDAATARRFACSLVQRALSVRNTDFECSFQVRLLERAQKMQPLNPVFFKAAILQSLSVAKQKQSKSHSAWGLRLYRKLRGEMKLAPDLELLHTVLGRFFAIHDWRGLYMVLEDYRTHHEAIPQSAYRLLISGLARQGYLDTINQLIREAIDRYGTEDISNYARSLLYACFRRAQVGEAVGVFESLQAEYGYRPDLRAWNILLATYSRVGDCDGVMALFEKLAAADLRPNSSTYGILMGMFAKKSDYEATTMLYERAISEAIKPSIGMLESLVLAQTTNDRLDEANETLEAALTMDLEPRSPRAPYLSGDHSRTRMWNAVLGRYAMNGQLDEVSLLCKRMQKAKIPFDDVTYATLIQAFCIKNQHYVARKILVEVMPKAGVRATALHYAILMGGFVTRRAYPEILDLSKRMLSKGLTPTPGTQNALMRAASRIDEQAQRDRIPENGTFNADRAEEVLAQTLDSLDPSQLAPLGPTKYSQSSSPNVALYASYFSYMIALYGRQRRFNKVAEIYDKFVSTARKFGPDVEVSPPVEILSALMVSYTNAGDHKETEKCWHLALEKSKEIACKAGADTSQPGWVLYKYRFLLALPLTRYMNSLQAMSRVDDIGPLIASLQDAGFQLSTPNWNKYIQILAQEGRVLPAFELCERELMDGWPGWEQFGSLRHAKRKIKVGWTPKSWEIGRRFPQYETLVYLAGLYLDAQGMAYGVRKELLKDCERVAPRAVEAVVRMPRFEDEIQERILRRD
ncbi:MAG: hypothetical protein Q9201_007808 [Fulgogasparrea decipioides]